MGTWTAAESHNATPVPAPGCGHSWGSLPTPPGGREYGGSGGRGNSSSPLNLLLTPSLSSPEPHSSTPAPALRGAVRLSFHLGVRHTAYRRKQNWRGGGRAPTQAKPSLAGPCSVAVECGVYLSPWERGESGWQCLQNALKIKRVIAGGLWGSTL